MTASEKLAQERARAYQCWRKGGIAWKQHLATLRNLERKARREKND